MSVDSGNDSVSDEFIIVLEGGRPWGFTLQGGADFRSPLKVGRVSIPQIITLVSHVFVLMVVSFSAHACCLCLFTQS